MRQYIRRGILSLVAQPRFHSFMLSFPKGHSIISGIAAVSFFHFIILSVSLALTGCKDFDEINTDPNNPEQVPMYSVFSGTQKLIFDNITDYYGRSRDYVCMPQYFSQRIYTLVSRYSTEEQSLTAQFQGFYLSFENLKRIEQSDAADQNLKAAARILGAWIVMSATDTWGDVPFFEIAQLREGKYTPAYDLQKDIYASLLKGLKEAQATMDTDRPVCPAGADQIYGGDALKWKRFANTLRCRLAVHLSKVDEHWREYIADAVADGVFGSTDDDASYHFSISGTEYCGFYRSMFVQSRNDFSISRVMTDLMQGKEDVLNGKTHPWKGVLDPRLPIYTNRAPDGSYTGVPYGIPKDIAEQALVGTCDWTVNPPYVVAKDYAIPMLSYAELMFILCEANDYDESYYRAGVGASIRHWAIAAMTSITPEDALAYVEAVTGDIFSSGDKVRMAEAVAVQKYIDLYTNPTEGWTELRRTGYPEQLLRPGEISDVVNGEEVEFRPLLPTRGFIRRRLPYPTSESTLNTANFNAAVSRLQDATNNAYSPMYWDVRTSPYDHPANK